MTTMRVDATHLSQVRQLWQQSRHLYHTLGAEDLATLLAKQIAILATDAGTTWGFVCIEAEARPPTLRATAPNRVYLRALALARGRAPAREVATLINAAITQLSPTPQGHLLIAYAEADWLRLALFQAGFTLMEEVQFFGLTHVARWQLPEVLDYPSLHLRACEFDDLPAVARLDADVFTPLWHFDVIALQEMLMTSRLQLAMIEDELVGYTALATSETTAHLARLAVHPKFQGLGLGKYLLREALAYAQSAGVDTVLLNTQVHNRPAQQLYRSVGFRPTGRITPVLTKQISGILVTQ